MIKVQFLQGTFRLSCDSRRVPLQPMQINALLALYCSGGPVERLVDLLRDTPTQGSHAALRTHIRRIRMKITAIDGRADELIVTTPIGDGQYTCQLASGVRCDAAGFSALAGSGSVALARGEYQPASDQLGAALALWGSITLKSQILPEAAGRPFAVQTREKLWQARKDAGISKAAAGINLGLHRRAAAQAAAGSPGRSPAAWRSCRRLIVA
jgi:DNA-binding SARP family transcriptional activator